MVDKSLRDYKRYAAKYLKIKTKDNRLISFKFNAAQERLWKAAREQMDAKKPVRMACLKGRQLGVCLDPSTRVLTGDLRWVQLGDLQVGDELVGITESPEEVPILPDKPRWVQGIRTVRYLVPTQVRNIVFRKANRVRLETTKGMIVATPEHRFLVDRLGPDMWMPPEVGMRIRYLTEPWGEPTAEDLWMGGVLDVCGGIVGTRGGPPRLVIPVVQGVILSRIVDYLTRAGIAFDVADTKHREWLEHSRIIVHRDFLFRLAGKTRAYKYTAIPWWERWVGLGDARVLHVEEIGEGEVVDLETTTGTFIADGYVSHNSTWSEGLVFWRTVTRPNTHSLVVAHDAESTKRIFQIAVTMYESLPAEVRPMRRRSNVKELIFENPDERERYLRPGLRSSIEVRTAGNKEAGRGSTFHCLHLSEVASWPDPELLATSLFPTVPPLPETIVVLESTAKGAGSWWHDFWIKSKDGATGYMPVFLPWYLDPVYSVSPEEAADLLTDPDEEEQELLKMGLTPEQVAFRRKTIASYGLDYWRQEMPTVDSEAWLGIGDPVFPRKVVAKMIETAMRNPPVWRGHLTERGMEADEEGPFVWWETPQAGQQYVIGVDVASGVEGGNLTAICVITRGETQRHVASWTGLISPLDAVPIIDRMARWYNEAMVSIEINGVGIAVQEALARSYYNLYRWRYLDARGGGLSPKLGWQTNVQTRPLLISHMQDMLLRGLFQTFDQQLLRQIYGYQWVGRTAFGDEAAPEPGVGDDLLMAAMIASFTEYVDSNRARSKMFETLPATTRVEMGDPAFVDLDDPRIVGEGGRVW